MIWRSGARKARICLMTTVNSGDRSLSASSMTNVGHSDRSAMPLDARSRTRPGVPTRMCTGCARRMMSSLRTVPPVVTMTLRPRCLPSVLQTCDVCSASSRVGTINSAWILGFFGLTFSSVGITNAAVWRVSGVVQRGRTLPVPFFARARICRPVNAWALSRVRARADAQSESPPPESATVAQSQPRRCPSAVPASDRSCTGQRGQGTTLNVLLKLVAFRGGHIFGLRPRVPRRRIQARAEVVSSRRRRG